MIKYTVLTFLIGDYEKIHEIEYDVSQTPYVNYICVTDNPNLVSKTWNIIYDEKLNNDKLTVWDKVFSIRYGAFKYTNDDVCVIIDGSIGIVRPLDELIEKFEKEKYDRCILLHGFRNSIVSEYIAWITQRDYSSDVALKYVKYLSHNLNYNLVYKGLCQTGLNIVRNDAFYLSVSEDMLNILKYENNGHCDRLDQTIFTALLSSKYPDKKYCFLTDSIFDGSIIKIYAHGDDKYPLRVYKERLIKPFFNNKEVNLIYN